MQREYQAARRSLEIGETVMGRPFVVHADDLTPYFILDSLKADPAALSMARKVLAPLLQQDKAPNYPLLHTLEVYLDKTCNTSAAARQLYLNRHSLLYRIAKIETLTGYRLDRRDDRFVLELSLRLLRIGRIEREGTEIR
jgi:DNA-binding PucR family transcriptional regulator